MKGTFFGTAPAHYGLIALCIAASMGATYAQSAIKPETPLVATFDRESAAAGQGNLSAAAELFDKSRECIVVHNIDKRMNSLQDDKNSMLNTPIKDDTTLTTNISRMEDAQKRADASRSICRGSEGKVTTKNIYDLALVAARLGDVSASACFMASPWAVENRDVDKAKAAQYKEAAGYLAKHMIEKGDWRFVRAMIIASSPGVRSGYAAYIQGDDAVGQLRYSELLRLGVARGSEDAENLELSIRILTDRLQPEEVVKSDEWAHDMFNRYYASRPRADAISACDA